MKKLFDFLGLVSFSKKEESLTLVEDLTQYKIKTLGQDYEGAIMFQNNKLIILKTSDVKVVKILKGSIQKIK